MTENVEVGTGWVKVHALSDDAQKRVVAAIEAALTTTDKPTTALDAGTIEACAKVAEQWMVPETHENHPFADRLDRQNATARQIAFAIRSLNSSPVGETEQEAEDRLFRNDAADNQRLIDWIADIIGLPHNEELTQENFSAWFTALPQAVAPQADWMKRAAEEILEWVINPIKIADSGYPHCHDAFADIIAKWANSENGK